MTPTITPFLTSAKRSAGAISTVTAMWMPATTRRLRIASQEAEIHLRQPTRLWLDFAWTHLMPTRTATSILMISPHSQPPFHRRQCETGKHRRASEQRHDRKGVVRLPNALTMRPLPHGRGSEKTRPITLDDSRNGQAVAVLIGIGVALIGNRNGQRGCTRSHSLLSAVHMYSALTRRLPFLMSIRFSTRNPPFIRHIGSR